MEGNLPEANKREQNTASLSDWDYMPATVVGHTERSDGYTLHTLDPDPDTDIETYFDDRSAHRATERRSS